MNDNFFSRAFSLYESAFDISLIDRSGLDYSNIQKSEKLAQYVKENNELLFVGLMRMYVKQELEGTKIPLSELVSKFEGFSSKVAAIKELNELLYQSSQAIKLDTASDNVVKTVESYINKKLDDKDQQLLIESSSELTNIASRYIKRCSVLSVGHVHVSVPAPNVLNEIVIEVKDFNEIPSLVSSLPNGFTVLILKNSGVIPENFAILAKTSSFSLMFTVTSDSFSRNHYDQDSVRSMLSTLFWRSDKSPSAHTSLPTLHVSGSYVEKKYSVKALEPLTVFNILNIVSLIQGDWHEHCSESELLALQSSISFIGNESREIAHLDLIAPIPVVDNSLAIASDYEQKMKALGVDCKTNMFVSSIFDARYDQVLNEKTAIYLESQKDGVNKSPFSQNPEMSEFSYNFLGSENEALINILYNARFNRKVELEKIIAAEYKEDLPEIKQYLLENVDLDYMMNKLASLDGKILEALTDDQVEYMELHNCTNSVFGIEKESKFHNCEFWYSSQYKKLSGGYSKETVCLNEQDESNGRHICPITGGYAQFYIRIEPSNPFEMEKVLNAKRDSMKFHLGYNGLMAKRDRKRYADPMNSISNKYLEQKYSFILGVSSKGFNKIRVENGLDKIAKKDLIGKFKKL